MITICFNAFLREAQQATAGVVAWVNYMTQQCAAQTPNKAAHPTAISIFLHFVAPFSPWMASAFVVGHSPSFPNPRAALWARAILIASLESPHLPMIRCDEADGEGKCVMLPSDV